MLSSLVNGIYSWWKSLEGVVASVYPKAKTEFVAFLGIVGDLAYMGQDYLTQLTGLNSNVITGSKVVIANIVLFSLAFWLRGIGDRVADRASVSKPTA